MNIPLWFIFGFSSAIMSAALMLSHERLKINGFAAAFWAKIVCVAVTFPFIIHAGLPADPRFYFFLGISAVLYAVSDVIFYAGITRNDAGAVARLLPASVIISFILWFFVNPALLDKYLASPVIATLIFMVLCLSAFLAMRLRHCAATRRAARSVWFVIFAACVGPILAKLVTLHAAESQGPAAYVFCQGLMMLGCWCAYATSRPASWREIVSRRVIGRGLVIGGFSAACTLLSVVAYYYVDNPAYIPAVRFLDSVLILGVYSLTGRTSDGDLRSGLALVACAAALVILKGQIG